MHNQNNLNRLQYLFGIGDTDPDEDITKMSIVEILKSEKFTTEERKEEYRRRGKSPSCVIDGIYNDTYLEDGQIYNDFNRDWDADA